MMKPAVPIVALVAIGLLLLVVYPPTVAGGWICHPETDQNAYTRKKIDCNKFPGAASVSGCQALCDNDSKCYGIVYADINWPKGKFCCFLKSKIDPSKWQNQVGRTLCEYE
ncbi:hypothetical protein CBR_g83464 [Chara braunii]|uniref:Apple domain-containing protein n=1 Tax=Chara braunii TaxID=69332 RepID=A0A388JJE0_CHABU|nr:hypothetical protein CBR_g83464 [Chara braunii]|eukprot:GBG41532.1 hypothetical protein CBR_g83464 [Chara braunii]